jgi:molybdopterin molybdotransferase
MAIGSTLRGLWRSMVEPFPAEGLPLEQALAAVLAAIKPLGQVQLVPLAQALGRVSAEALLASEAIPGFRASILDGYAVARLQPVPMARSCSLVKRSASSPVPPCPLVRFGCWLKS